MTDSVKAQRKPRATKSAVTGNEMSDLRVKLSEQVAEIEALRTELEASRAELLARDAETDQMLAEFADARTMDEDDPRLVHWHQTQRLRHFLREHIPRGSRIAVVAGDGDSALVSHPGCKVEHLSQDRAGGYLGAHPSSSRAAVAQVEAARWRGADLLWIPRSGLWWLEHYGDLARHLERRYALVVLDGEAGAVWDLRRPSPLREVDDLLAGLRLERAREPVILDWHTGHAFTELFGECNVFAPPGNGPELPYLDGTIDVVAVPAGDRERISEARRVATALVVAVSGSKAAPAVEMLWQAEPEHVGLADVSVIVVSQDGRSATGPFLEHLLDTLPGSFTGELLVDAAISSRVPRPESQSARIRSIQVDGFRDDAGFTMRVRQGAVSASGNVLVVVDGSTWPVAGWLPPLVHLLRHVPKAGAVAGMLLEPDGCPAHPGWPADADCDGARYSHVQPMDVAPGALFATHRGPFLEWSRVPRNGHDLVAAFCAHVRSSGRTVLYQPEAVAISPWLDVDRPRRVDRRLEAER